MTRSQILDYVNDQYGTLPEHLWAKYPQYEVLRHSSNKKWYGALMDIPQNKIGLSGDAIIDILVLKGNPDDIVHIIEMNGFTPAYHMNKKHWFTVILKEISNNDMIYQMIDKSYSLTKKPEK